MISARFWRLSGMLVLFFIFCYSSAQALEQINNGSFTNATGAEWTIDNLVDQPNALSVLTRLTNDGDGDARCFHGSYTVGPAGSVNLFYYADGLIYQTFPTVTRASDTNALIDLSYREVHTGSNWIANLTGTVRRNDSPTTILSTFLNIQNSGIVNFDSGWLSNTDHSVTLPGGYQYRMHFYWNMGCQKSNTAGIKIDKASVNLSPSGLTASETTAGACSLNWVDSVSSVVTLNNYRIYRTTSLESGWGAAIGTSATSDYTDPAPPNAETVYYAVTDVDTTGKESPISPYAVFKKARLVITRVEAAPTTVTVGQSGIPVKVYVENVGYSPARLSEIDLYFSDPAIGQYSKTLQTSLPIDLAGGASTTLTFSVDVLTTSIPDTDVINAIATGTNRQTSATIVATSSLQPHSWLIRSPANLVVQKITTPATVYRDQKDVEISVEVINDGNKNAAAYWDSTELTFDLGLYENIRVVDSLPVPVYPGSPVTIKYLVDVSPVSATGTCVVDANITFRDVNLLTPSTNFDGANEPGLWTVVAGVMKTYKGPPKYPSFTIESESFNQGTTIVYAKTENLMPLEEQRFRWYNPSGVLVRVTDPPLTTDGSGVMTDQFSLDAASPLGMWRVIATRVTNDTPLAEKQFYVVSPAAISIQHRFPDTVTLDQSFIATTTITNSGGAAVDDAFPGNIPTLGGITGAATLISGPAPDTSAIAGLGQATFTWQFTATGIGSYTVQGAGYGYDSNDSTYLTAATQSSNMCIIQSKPVLSVVSVTESYTNVYRNQTGLTVNMLIRNTGQAAVYVDTATLAFSNGTHQQIIASPSVMPFLLNGNSDATVVFTVSIGATSNTGQVDISGSYTAYEANNPASTYNVGPVTAVNAWNILSTSGRCAANSSYSPEQYTYNQGQTIHVEFSGLAVNTPHTIFLYDPLGVERDNSGVRSSSGVGVYSDSFLIPTDAGAQYLTQWRLVIRKVKSPAGTVDPADNVQGEQFFLVQAPGQLVATLTITPTSLELGNNITVTMSLANNVASSSSIYPATPSMPLLAAGYTGAAATLVSGPVPASATIRYGFPATFTWVFTTTDFTDIGSSFAMSAKATGIDLNTTNAETLRVVTSNTSTSNSILILSRNLEMTPDPLDLGTLVCGQQLDYPGILKNTGNTSLTKVLWQKAYPTAPSGSKIPYAYFDFIPASGFTVATGTLNTNCTLSLRIPYNQPPGTYTAIMAVFDDLSGNNARDLGEPYDEFTVKVIASECRVVMTDVEQVELGGWPIDVNTATATIGIMNGGNLGLTNLKFQQLSATFANSTVYVLPTDFGALATDAVRLASVAAWVGNDPPGEHIATWTIWDDLNDNDSVDANEASDTFRVRFSVGTKNFTITPSPKDLGNATPTHTLTNFTVSITNTGDLTIHNPAPSLNNLVQGAYSISADYLTLELPGPIAPLETKIATISLYIPAGTAVGLFSGTQFIFDDENEDGIPSGTANEVEVGFLLQVTINPYYSIQTIPATVDLGGLAPGEPAKSVGFLCRNAGNVPLNDLTWQETILYDNALQITTDRYDITPAPAFSVNFGETFMATISMSLLDTQSPGLYTGNFGWLYNDNPVASTSDNFTISCQVGSKAVDIIEAGPLVATGTPNSLSSAFTYRIKNTGSLILAKPRAMAIANLTDGANSIPAASCVFTPSTFDYLNPGQTKTGTWAVQIPAGQAIGTYTGTLKVWDDTNNNYLPDAAEASDTVSLEARVTGKRVLTVTPSPADLFFIPAGQNGTINLTVTNSGNMPINAPEEIRAKIFPLNPVAPGPPSIGESQIEFTPVPLAGSLAVGASCNITASVTVPFGQTSGPYQGYQVIYDDYNVNDNDYNGVGEESFSLLLKLTVGEKKLSVTPAVNLGSGNPTVPDQITPLSANFEAKNLTSIPLSKLKWSKNPLISGANSIATAAFAFTPAGPFNISSNGTRAVAASLTIPMYQPPGTYSAAQTLYEDENNNGIVDGFEASGTFTLSVTVNSFQRVQISPSPADLGAILAGETTDPFDVTVTNVGNVDLNGLDALWNKVDLTGAGTINSALINFSSLPSPLPVASYAITQVTVGPVGAAQAAGMYAGIQTLIGRNLDLRLEVSSSATGPTLPEGTIFQEVATSSFSNVAPETIIFSTYFCATGSVKIGFLETLPDSSEYSFNRVEFNSATKTLTRNGAAIISAEAVPVDKQDHPVHGELQWYRLYMTFNYQFVENNASRTYIVLQNSTPDADLALASYSVWFDGIQLEKAVIPGQTRPTAFGEKGKLISPSAETTLDGLKKHYEW